MRNKAINICMCCCHHTKEIDVVFGEDYISTAKFRVSSPHITLGPSPYMPQR
jgi:hypothetical protein